MGLDTHLSLQEPDTFPTAIQPQVCCWEGAGSGFAVRHCARWWWCGWLWGSPTCASSQPSWHISARSPTLLILCCLFYSLQLLLFFPESKRCQVENVGHHCTRAALSWVAAVVLHFPKARQRQTLARSFLTKVWHASDAEHCLSSFRPYWDAAGARALVLAGCPGRGHTDVARSQDHIEHLSPRELDC